LSATVTLHISSLRVRFGSRDILHLRPTTLASDHIHLITGDNGVGKSTLLRALAGLHRPDQLDYALSRDGKPLNHRHDVTYVHQQPYLLSHSVKANIAYGLRQRGIEANALQQRVSEIVEQFDLSRLIDRAPALLSGGERMKVALARGIATGAQLLLVDEPTANLDAQARQSIFALLEQLANDAWPRLVLIATHDAALLTQAPLKQWRLEQGELLSATPTLTPRSEKRF
jgi:tungstate transport system ATP-binding protein